MNKFLTRDGKLDYARSRHKTGFFLEREISSYYCSVEEYPVYDYFVRIPLGEKEIRIYFKPDHYVGVSMLDMMFAVSDKLLLKQEYYLSFEYSDRRYFIGESQVFAKTNGLCCLIEPLHEIDKALWEIALYRKRLLPEVAALFEEAGERNEASNRP